MSDERPSTFVLLDSIDKSLKALLEIARASQPKPVASVAQMDGQYGNPILKAMPRSWTGDGYKGRTFSECPADLLELVADMHDYFADKADRESKTTSGGKPVAPYERRDASLARGWAQRKRGGYQSPDTTASPGGEDSGFDGTADPELGF